MLFRSNWQKILYVFIFGFFITLLTGFCTLKHLRREKKTDETKTVYIKNTENGFQLYRNGSPFYIQGASGNSHFEELSGIGGNTIRVFDTINIQHVLNEAHKNNLAVIVDIPLPKYTIEFNSYLNDEDNKVLKQRIKALVKKYKSHPAMLMWNLGNEVHYPIDRKSTRLNSSH